MLRAIDLYSGIGGWALGLRVAGIEIVRSYEWWPSAVRTESQNLGLEVIQGDIRNLELGDLPENIDVVVGSPPCTQFSYANRGGSGDIADGLLDIAKFLEVVEHLKPKFWAMENVPRVAKILDKELTPDGKLKRFVHLREKMDIRVYDFSSFGLPQRRKRCVAGVFPSDLLDSYKAKTRPTTLGEAISGLENDVVVDVNYGSRVSANQLVDHIKEDFFDFEEVRINEESKNHHPVYNDMSFPDPWNRSVRTVTATCTRVSRESIVIDDVANPGEYRRLTVRERGVLQGFPITYQFYGRSYAEKLKMIGNAIPPVFTYYLANAFQQVPFRKLVPLSTRGYVHPVPAELPKQTTPDTSGHTYPPNRRFWFSIRNLRFKSGMRFDLKNDFNEGGGNASWRVDFHYGPSKDIRVIRLNGGIQRAIHESNWITEALPHLNGVLSKFSENVRAVDICSLQSTWTDKTSEGPHPFHLLDLLGDYASELIDGFDDRFVEDAGDLIMSIASDTHGTQKLVGEGKLRKYSKEVVCGMLLGTAFNKIAA